MINPVFEAAFRANKQRLCRASTSQPVASNPTVTIPGPSHHMTATPSVVPSATNTAQHFPFGSVNYEDVAKAGEFFRIKNRLNEALQRYREVAGLLVNTKQEVRKNLVLESWVNDATKAAIVLDDIGDEMFTEMLRLQAKGHDSFSDETRSVRRKILLKVIKLSEELEDLIKRASLYGLGTNNGDTLQCGTCKSLQALHSIKAVPTYACY